MTVTDDPIAEILRKDPRYPRAAYEFVREVLERTAGEGEGRRHITARELLEGIRRDAKAEFGPLARTVLASWNVHATADFGNIVFNLVEAQEMGKTDEDQISDFEGVYGFDEAFPPELGDVEVAEDDEDDV